MFSTTWAYIDHVLVPPGATTPEFAHETVGEAYYVEQSIDPPGPSIDDTGYRVTGGVRWVPFKLLELDGFANYNDVTDKSDTSWEGRAIINIWRLGFGADYEKFDTSDQWNAFVRFNFGRR